MLQFHEVPISEASPEQLTQATEIVNLANAAYERIFPGDRLRPGSISEDYADGILVLASNHSSPVATATLFLEKDRIKINLLAVKRESGGQNLGARLLEYADHRARQLGLKSLWLEAVDRGPLVDYYLRLGFKEDFRAF